MLPSVAIFTTSDIQTGEWDRNRFLGATSTGNLEIALANGFQCFVASTRRTLGTHDDWWVERVGKDHVFLAHDLMFPGVCEDDFEVDGGWFVNHVWVPADYTASGWHGLYRRLLEVWPHCEGRACQWQAGRQRLRNLGYVLGSEFGIHRSGNIYLEELKVRLHEYHKKAEPNCVHGKAQTEHCHECARNGSFQSSTIA